jgi:hypothetical protein
MKIYFWDLCSTFLTEYRLALETYWLDLGDVALLGPYFWILESISCLCQVPFLMLCCLRSNHYRRFLGKNVSNRSTISILEIDGHGKSLRCLVVHKAALGTIPCPVKRGQYIIIISRTMYGA